MPRLLIRANIWVFALSDPAVPKIAQTAPPKIAVSGSKCYSVLLARLTVSSGQRVVRELTEKIHEGRLRIQSSALEALQEAAESFLVSLFGACWCELGANQFGTCILPARIT